MWLEKSFLKKFHDSCPSTEYMATRLAESIPSLKNLRPIPGAVLSLLVSGSNAKESLGWGHICIYANMHLLWKKQILTWPAHVEPP